MELEDITTLTATSPSNLIDLDEELLSSHRTWAFRGQPQTFGTLVPSFRREFGKTTSVKTVEFIESELISAFREHYLSLQTTMSNMPAYSEIQAGMDLRCLSVMQHYGVPTRLLDWSTDFWTSVYFACAGDPGHDAELWCYDRDSFRTASEKALSQANLVFAPAYDPPILGRRDLHLVLEVGQQLTPRMRQQKAHHTVASEVFADHAPLMYQILAKAETNSQPLEFFRVVIAQRAKDKVIKYLNEHKKISASTIFPDFEGLGRFLRWQLDSLVTTLL